MDWTEHSQRDTEGDDRRALTSNVDFHAVHDLATTARLPDLPAVIMSITKVARRDEHQRAGDVAVLQGEQLRVLVQLLKLN